MNINGAYVLDVYTKYDLNVFCPSEMADQLSDYAYLFRTSAEPSSTVQVEWYGDGRYLFQTDDFDIAQRYGFQLAEEYFGQPKDEDEEVKLPY